MCCHKTKPCFNEGIITPLLKKIGGLNKYSPTEYIKWWCRKKCSGYAIVDAMVIIYFLVPAIVAFILLGICEIEFYLCVIIILTIIFSVRLLFLLIKWCEEMFPQIVPKGERVLSVPRFIALVLFNLAEVAVIFGIFAYFARKSFDPELTTIWHSTYYSIGLLTARPIENNPANAIGATIYAVEIFFSIIIILVVIQYAVSQYKR